MDTKYRVKKILNNNVVLATQGLQEVIVVGLGIGHNLKTLQVIKSDKIEKVFRLDREDFVKTLQLINDIPKNMFLDIYTVIDQCAQKSDLSLDEHAYITLIDHINFALERHRKGQDIRNFLAADLKILYGDEYRLSEQILEGINTKLAVDLPYDEVGFLTVHIVNGSKPDIQNKSSIITDTVLNCLNIVRDTFLVSLKQEDLVTQRIMIHLKMLVQRIVSSQQMSADEVILENVIHEFSQAYGCALKIKGYIEERLRASITQQEIVYLTIHLNRILTASQHH